MRTRFVGLRRFIAAAGVAIAIVGSTVPALAANPEALKKFEEGKKHRAEGDCGKAVVYFEESVAIESTIGGHYNLGYCYEQLNKPEKAYESYKRALKAAQDKKDPREEEIRDATIRTRDNVHWVRLDVPEKVKKAPGLRVTVDGELVPANEYGADVILRKSARHEVVVSATGHKDWTVTNQPDHNTIVLDLGEAVTEAKPKETPPPGESKAADGSFQRIASIVLIGVGGAGLITGGALGVYYLSENDDRAKAGSEAQTSCVRNRKGEANGAPIQAWCNEHEDGAKSYLDWHDNTILATWITIPVSAVLLAGGIYLLVTAPSGKEIAGRVRVRLVPEATPTTSGLSLHGTF